MQDLMNPEQRTSLALKDLIKPERLVIKILNKGEFLKCHVSPKQLMPFQATKPILTVMNIEERIYGEVEAEKVYVTCFPKDNDLVREYFADLPEVEYEP